MCLAMVQPAGEIIPADAIECGWQMNDDGAGVAYCDRGKVRIVKGLTTAAATIRAYNRIRAAAKDSPILLHLRLATHGKKDAANTHPFWITPNESAMIHNGIIHTPITNAARSDTWHYAQMLRKELPNAARVPDAVTCGVIAADIGVGNKIAILDAARDFTIIGEKQGVWDAGIWYSNEYYTDRWVHSSGYVERCDRCYEELHADGEIDSGYCTDCLQSFLANCEYLSCLARNE